nr:hypothetical protein [Tanacetum cinerariifolium]
MVTVSKTISIPNEDLSDDTTPRVARKILNEVKSSLVTLQRVVKQKVTLEVYNWSSSAHKEVHRIISHEIALIIYQVDARVQNFKTQFLQEAAKFVRDFKSLTKEADESLDTQKSLELKIDASNTLDPLNQKLESKIVQLEFQVVNYERKISHLKTTYKNLFDSITSNQAHAKLHDLIYENAKLRARVFENTSESMKNTSGMSVTPHVDKPRLSAVTPHFKKLRASTPLHSVPQLREFNVMKHRNVIAPGMFKINSSQTSRVDLVPNKQSIAIIRTNLITNSQRHVIVKDNVSSNTVTTSYTGLVHTARTRKPQPKGNTRNARVPSASKSSEVKKNITVEEHRRTLLLSKNQKTMSSESSPICVMARATPTKSWLWHQRLSHINFDTINDLSKNDLVSGLPKLKYAKEHICLSCEQGKSKRASHPPKPGPNSKQRLHLLHMDLSGPMRVASIIGKRYVLVIVDDYSRYNWVYFLRTKDEMLEVIKNLLKKIYVRLQAPVIIIRTNNKTEFKNYVLKEYFDSVGITHETSAAKTPQQNGVVEPIATACYTQNRSIIHQRFNKTPYKLIQGRKLDISYLHVFRALCYLKNDREDIGKLGAKGDIGFFIGYSANSGTYRVYHWRKKKIMETMNVISELKLTYAPSTITPQRPSERDLDILFEPLHNEYLGGRQSEAPRAIPAAPVIHNLQAPTASMSFQDSAPVPTNSLNTPVSSHNVDTTSQQHAHQQSNLTPSPTASAADNVPNAVFEGDLFVNPFTTPSTESVVSSTQYVDPSNMHTFYQPIMEPKSVKEALTDPAWIESMQEELHQFIRLNVWELVLSPDGVKPLTLK